jgi:hypothetical protein
MPSNVEHGGPAGGEPDKPFSRNSSFIFLISRPENALFYCRSRAEEKMRKKYQFCLEGPPWKQFYSGQDKVWA